MLSHVTSAKLPADYYYTQSCVDKAGCDYRDCHGLSFLTEYLYYGVRFTLEANHIFIFQNQNILLLSSLLFNKKCPPTLAGTCLNITKGIVKH